MIGFGTAFGFGWFLHRQTALLAEWKNRWGLNLGIALALTIFCLYLVGLKPDFMAMFTGKNLEGWRDISLCRCLYNSRLVLDIRYSRRRFALLFRVQRTSALPGRCLILVIPYAPAGHCLSSGSHGKSAPALVLQVHSDIGGYDSTRPDKLPLSRTFNLHRQHFKRPPISGNTCRCGNNRRADIFGCYRLRTSFIQRSGKSYLDRVCPLINSNMLPRIGNDL